MNDDYDGSSSVELGLGPVVSTLAALVGPLEDRCTSALTGLTMNVFEMCLTQVTNSVDRCIRLGESGGVEASRCFDLSKGLI